MEKDRRIEDQRIRDDFDNIDFSDFFKDDEDDAYFEEQVSGQKAKKRKQELQPSRPMICNTCCKKFLYERSFDKHIEKICTEVKQSKNIKKSA